MIEIYKSHDESCTGKNNVKMKEEQCIIYITFLTCAFAFNLSCPELGHWNHRATAHCFDLNKYTCLLDTTKNRYTETCDGPREEIVGYRTTINRNNFNTVQCKSERYQIQDFTTVGNSDCIFQKSKCAQEGQVVYKVNNDSSVEDTKCMCDYTKGYSFVTLPISRCFCTPSVEDCSCFREFCPSDYQCTTEYELRTRSLNCTNISFSDDGGDDRHMIRRNMAQDDPNIDISNIIAATITVISLIIMIIGLLCWYHRKTIKDKIGGVMILAHYKEHKSNSENPSCSPIEGEEIEHVKTHYKEHKSNNENTSCSTIEGEKIEHVKTHYKEHKSNNENTSCSPIEGEEIEHVKSTPEQHANNDISDSSNDDTGSEGSDHFSTASENHENSTDDSGATTQKYEISKPVCKKDKNNLVSGSKSNINFILY
ncbi:unnamed protein product [Mytilus coruscus]|uniref:Uncharacterized protein n=1 Tax=Mytilus coruscus TaxID=42192 RepID=A0A6J8B392_MYTCO|nr:unnamed protein product [Mytilus coruscus]